MTIWITSVRQHAKSAQEAPRKASALANALRDRLSAAALFTDPNLSDEGLANKRRELADAVRAEAESLLAQYRHEAAAAREYLQAQAKENTRIPDDAAALIRAEQRWRQVERVLEAGGDLHAEIRNADAVTVTAILEHAPSYLAAKHYRPPGLGEAAFGEREPRHIGDGHLATAYRRLAQLSPDPALSELLIAATTAPALEDAAAPWHNAVDSMVTSGGADLLAAAIASQIAMQGVTIDSAPPSEAAA